MNTQIQIKESDNTEFCTMAVYNYFKNKYPINPDIKLISYLNGSICEIPKYLQNELQIFIDSFSQGFNKASDEYKKVKEDVNKIEAKIKEHIENEKQSTIKFEKLKDDYAIVLKRYEAFKSLLDQANSKASDSYQRGYKDGSHSQANADVQTMTAYEKSVKYKHFEAGYAKGIKDGKSEEQLKSIIPSNACDVEVFAIKDSNQFSTGLQAFIGYNYPIDNGTSFTFKQVQCSITNPNKKQTYGCKTNEETKGIIS